MHRSKKSSAETTPLTIEAPTSRYESLRWKIYALFGIAVFVFIVAAVLGSFGPVAYSRTQGSTGSTIELLAGVDSTVRAYLADTTLVVTGCTNESIATTNSVVSGKIIIAHGCPVIEGRQCVESVCMSNGDCTEITIGECSLDEQCADIYGPSYSCNTSTCSCIQIIPANGTAAANGLVCSGGLVTVSTATCPVAGYVLTAIDNQTAEWASPTDFLGVDVFINSSISVGQFLIVEVENTTAVWKSPLDAGFVTLTDPQTLTNKTLTAPIISTIINVGTITLPNTTGTLVAEETATGTATLSGIWAANRTATYNLSKIGHQVMLWLGTSGLATTNAVDVITSDAFIPAAFRPVSDIVHYSYVLNNNTRVWTYGTINTAGVMVVTASTTGDNFSSGTTNTGINQNQVFRWYT